MTVPGGAVCGVENTVKRNDFMSLSLLILVLPKFPGHDLDDGGTTQRHVLAVHHLLPHFPAVLEGAGQAPVHLQRDAAIG